jgi:ubiquinone biosynthesis protein COQ9
MKNFPERAAAAIRGGFPDAPLADRRRAATVAGHAPRERIARGEHDRVQSRTRFGPSARESRPTRGFAAGADSSDAGTDPAASTSDGASETSERLGEESKRRKDEDRDRTRALTERLLAAATRRVAEHGWSEAALRAAADDLGYSRAVVGAVRGGAGALVNHFCEDCDSRLSVRIVMETEEALDPLSPSERLATAIKWRLEMLEPVIETWPAALALQAAPENAAATATRVALLADELVGAMGAHGVGLSRATRAAVATGLQDPIPPEKEERPSDAAGAAADETDAAAAADVTRAETEKPREKAGSVSPSPLAAAFASAGWYADRAAVAALYGACELFMVGDTSPGFEDTRAFVDARVSELATFAAAAEEAATSAAAASRSVGIEPGTLGMPFPLPPGAKQLVEGVFAKAVEAATRAGAAKR